MPFKNYTWAPEAYEYIRTHWPYLNRSIAANQTRHFITLTCDQGPFSCKYQPNGWQPIQRGLAPSFYDPAHSDRVVGACPEHSSERNIEQIWD